MERPSPMLARQVAPQTVNDALEAVAAAFRDHKKIAVDAAGTLQAGRTQEGIRDFRQILSRLFIDRAEPADALHAKMVKEVSTLMEIDAERAAYIVNKRVGALPDIRNAMAMHEMAPIADRWIRLTTDLSTMKANAAEEHFQ